ncbi:transcription antitermination factor NusB [Sporosarcina sp. P3]|uniref:Transcription antitermination protein NusB n=1 Tax=Sporosarcina ureae TaxID=1571 RepID=A0ABN4YIZ5_SPOUR|nr:MULTISPECIES: transcription antitermination factor NusB [Sporosarcina]ARF12759.1 N utilization substance protein B [Sporosarcina ureae]ARF15891.1 N utilization substance protein B [Sporosarcina ureae]PIC59169.1 transcription antitermination factor NusB [Sporosarcina sp. P10]PIC62490.1 transcription antitermination factor NusB [Sporosarcina sp. P12(2017)]PID23011.1 transcription antitermination factor NusB [Sporosarcina sp. P3]
MKRREAREKAIQTLFQLDNSEMNVDEAIGYIVETPLDSFYEQLVRGTAEHLTEVDSEITNKLENWTIDRLPKIERTVLRLAVYELLYNEEVPNRVIMNEAIELCKTFGDEKSGRFVNGVLSKFQ